MSIRTTVIVVTLNRPECVRRCLTCLGAQTTPIDQTIVVDASQDDQTKRVVNEFPGVMYLRNESGYGKMTVSRNIGLKASLGDVIAFVDDDAFAEPAWMGELLKCYGDPRAGAAGGRVLTPGITQPSSPAEQVGRLDRKGILLGNFWSDFDHPIQVQHVMGCNMSFRRQTLIDLGGFREMFVGISGVNEDSDMCLRVGRAGWKLIFNSKAVVEHLGAPQVAGKRFDTRYTFFVGRNHSMMLVQNLGVFSSTLWTFVFMTIVQWCGRMIRRPNLLVKGLAMFAGLSIGIPAGIWHRARYGMNPVRTDPEGESIREALKRNANPQLAIV